MPTHLKRRTGIISMPKTSYLSHTPIEDYKNEIIQSSTTYQDFLNKALSFTARSIKDVFIRRIKFSVTA